MRKKKKIQIVTYSLVTGNYVKFPFSLVSIKKTIQLESSLSYLTVPLFPPSLRSNPAILLPLLLFTLVWTTHLIFHVSIHKQFSNSWYRYLTIQQIHTWNMHLRKQFNATDSPTKTEVLKNNRWTTRYCKKQEYENDMNRRYCKRKGVRKKKKFYCEFYICWHKQWRMDVE